MQPRKPWLILSSTLDLTRAYRNEGQQRVIMADRTLTILIGDAQPRVRFGLHVLLEEQPGWQVAGEAVDAQALLDQIRGGCPDLVLLDWELLGMPAEELLATIRLACPDLRVIFMSHNDELREAALRAGADVFAYKADPPEKLLRLIRELTAVKVAK
jgi:DNA-binding NarL/FixJ family response regulator